MLPVQTLSDPQQLIDAYEWIVAREEEIRARLKKIMPDYCAKAASAGNEVRRLWEEYNRQRKI